MKHSKIIFLDIDGVLNLPPYQCFDTECLHNLQMIISQTGAKIVVSSSWRCDVEPMRKQFTENGFPQDLFGEIVGITCRGYHNVVKGSKLPIVRGNEIKEWVDTQLVYPWHANPEMDAMYREVDEQGNFKRMKSNKPGRDFTYVILDDDDDMLLEQLPWFVQTEWDKGLTKERAEKAVDLLNSTPTPKSSVATDDASSNADGNIK